MPTEASRRDAAFRHIPLDQVGGRAHAKRERAQRIGQARLAQANQRQDECRRIDTGLGRRDRPETGRRRGEHRLRDAGPEKFEQGAGGRRLEAVVILLIDPCGADQMQIADCAGGGDVEQALVFMGGALGLELLQIIVGARLAVVVPRPSSARPAGARGRQRRRLRPTAAGCCRCRRSRGGAGRGRSRYRIQALGLVDGHHLHRVAERIGRRVQPATWVASASALRLRAATSWSISRKKPSTSFMASGASRRAGRRASARRLPASAAVLAAAPSKPGATPRGHGSGVAGHRREGGRRASSCISCQMVAFLASAASA